MLSDEEKKAVEILKEFLEKLEEFDFDCQECGFNQQDEGKALKILLNLIEKQSKEIEELKDMNERQKYRIELVSEDKIKKFPVTITKEELQERWKE